MAGTDGLSDAAAVFDHIRISGNVELAIGNGFQLIFGDAFVLDAAIDDVNQVFAGQIAVFAVDFTEFFDVLHKVGNAVALSRVKFIGVAFDIFGDSNAGRSAFGHSGLNAFGRSAFGSNIPIFLHFFGGHFRQRKGRGGFA